jgi:hypothetical protein
VPEVCRGWGVGLAPDGSAIDICVYAHSGLRTLANLAENDHAAITLTSPSTYRSLQIKGRATVSAAGEDDLALVARHQRAFVEEVAAVGLSAESSARLFGAEADVSAAMARIRITVEAMFDQTPGPGAGGRW